MLFLAPTQAFEATLQGSTLEDTQVPAIPSVLKVNSFEAQHSPETKAKQNALEMKSFCAVCYSFPQFTWERFLLAPDFCAFPGW